MKDKLVEGLIATALAIVMLCLIGGGLWWGATAAYSWFDAWARGDEVQHEWHLHERAGDEAVPVTTGGQLRSDVLREVYVEDAAWQASHFHVPPSRVQGCASRSNCGTPTP